MSITPLLSSPVNLKNFYNIPDRDPSIPISIGIYEDGSYAYRKDVKDYYNKYLQNENIPYSSYFSNSYPGTSSLPCNVEFVDYPNDNAKQTAINKWNGTTTTSRNDAEASLDIQVICGICKLGLHEDDKLTFFVHNAYADQLAYNLFTYLNTKKDDVNVPRIWSISYGWFEDQADLSSIADIINNLSKNHFQIFVATGDSGSSNKRQHADGSYSYYGPIQPTIPATFPYITGVSGTIVSYDNKEYPSTTTLTLNSKLPIITTGGGMEGCSIDENYHITVSPTFNEKYSDIFKSQHSAVKGYLDELSNSTTDNINQTFIQQIKTVSDNYGYYPRSYPNIALQSINYPTYVGGYEENVAGTSASAPLMAAIYAIIASRLKFNITDNHQYGNLNNQLFAANEDSNTQKKVFNSVRSFDNKNDNNGATEDPTDIEKYSWNVANSRLSTNPSGDGYGFDCVVGLGSINATELMSYISCNHVAPHLQVPEFSALPKPLQFNIKGISISSGMLTINYNNPLDNNTYSCDTTSGMCKLDASSSMNHTECSNSCKADMYTCHANTGQCVHDTKGTHKLSECKASCHIQKYSCESGHCVKSDTGTLTAEECSNGCYPKYYCDKITGTCINSPDKGTHPLSVCKASCTIQKYSCESGHCVKSDTGNLTATECSTSCHQPVSKYYCDNTTGTCINSQDKGTYTLSECNESCHIQMYSCNSGHCVKSDTGTLTAAECSNSCYPKYYCDKITGTCINSPDKGTQSHHDCKVSCIPQMYSCDTSTGTCKQDPRGTSTFAVCKGSCVKKEDGYSCNGEVCQPSSTSSDSKCECQAKCNSSLYTSPPSPPSNSCSGTDCDADNLCHFSNSQSGQCYPYNKSDCVLFEGTWCGSD